MARKFPVKRLKSMSGGASSTLTAYDNLDHILDDNPLAAAMTMYQGSYMPDMSRAVRLGNAIYRVNVPGFFYHHVKNPTASASKKSGLLISEYPSLIDTYMGLTVREHKSGSEPKENQKLDQYNGTEMCLSTRSNNTSARGYKFDICNVDGTTVTSSNKKVAVIADPRYATTDKGNHRATYFVNSGKGGTGGLANNMIPIIPGYGADNSDGNGILDKHFIYENVPGTSFTSTNQSIGAARSDICWYEGRGTYIYYYHEAPGYGEAGSTDASDEYLFIPSMNTPTDVQPVTKIREVFTRIGTDIGNGEKLNADMALWHYCAKKHSNHGSAYWALLKRVAEGGTSAAANITAHVDLDYRYSKWTSGKFTKAEGLKNQIQFMLSFSNQSIKALRTKFLVQWMYKIPGFNWNAEQVFPTGTKKLTQEVTCASCYNFNTNFGDINAAMNDYFRGYTQFNPVVDGPYGPGQTIAAKYESQKDLTYE